MPLRNLSLTIFCLLGLAIIFLAASNLQPVDLSLLGAHHQVSLGILLLAALATGSASGLCLSTSSSPRRLQEWQAQDSKLMSEIKSDRERQLESKIETLEAALKQALKKS